MQRQRVNRTFAIDGSTDRVVLFSWSADREPRRRNVGRVDHHGNVVWRAELPGDVPSDCFVSLARHDTGFVARTFSEWAVHLDEAGRSLQVSRAPIAVAAP